MVATLSLIAISAAFSACGPTITNENLKVVDDQRAKLEAAGKGLSPKGSGVDSGSAQAHRDHQAVAGNSEKKEVDVVRYYYQQDGELIETSFCG
jgi:hypothetical protein